MIDLREFLRIGSVSCGVLFFVGLLIFNFFKKRKNQLGDLMVVGFGGSTLPTGIVLVWCGFSPSGMSKLVDVGVYVSIAGLALLFVAISQLREKL
jgi:hypothetical protein